MKKFCFACAVMILGAICFAGIISSGAAPQDGEPVLSPPAKTSCTFEDGKTISMNYSSPRRKARRIYGGLVPWGEVWRIGANDATTLVTNTDVIVDGKTVPAGGYTLFAIPAPTKWTLIVSKKTGEWGIPYPGEEFDFLRANMMVSKLAERLENLAVHLDRAGAACWLRVDWENTRASVQISEQK